MLNETIINTLTENELQVLIDMYVFDKNEKKALTDNHVTKKQFDTAIENAQKKLIYESRVQHRALKRSQFTVNRKELEKKIWTHFIKQRISTGKTTLDIANEVGQPLEKINAFL